MPFQNSNLTANIPINDPFQVGRSDLDGGPVIEQGNFLPWPADPAASYIYYECAIGTMLDSGIVVHNRLPQVNNPADSVSVLALDDPDLDTFVGVGVNLRCKDQYRDIVQRMGHARYWFRLWGQALRVGYQVPIPGIKLIGGVPAIPYDKNPQWAFNRIHPGGNYSGIIMWHAVWSLWYTTATPPITQTIPAADPAAHISSNVAPPPVGGVQCPYSQPDGNAVTAAPPIRGPERGFPTTRGR